MTEIPCENLEAVLSHDMATISSYLQTWRLKLSHTKTVTTAFHLNNREAKRKLNIYNNGKLLPFYPVPTYLGVKLDSLLTYRHHLKALRKKLTTRIALLRRLAGSRWGAGAKSLRIVALLLVYSTAEYCAPVWCRSAHTRLTMTRCVLSLVASVQLQRTVYLSLQASIRLSYAD